MADLGAVGVPALMKATIPVPSSRSHVGTLSITGTARVGQVAMSTRISLYGERMMRRLYDTSSKADGSFVCPNIRAGRYIVVIGGMLDYLPGVHAVDVA